jgi:hypothetical protein
MSFDRTPGAVGRFKEDLAAVLADVGLILGKSGIDTGGKTYLSDSLSQLPDSGPVTEESESEPSSETDIIISRPSDAFVGTSCPQKHEKLHIYTHYSTSVPKGLMRWMLSASFPVVFDNVWRSLHTLIFSLRRTSCSQSYTNFDCNCTQTWQGGVAGVLLEVDTA